MPSVFFCLFVGHEGDDGQEQALLAAFPSLFFLAFVAVDFTVEVFQLSTEPLDPREGAHQHHHNQQQKNDHDAGDGFIGGQIRFGEIIRHGF